MLRQTDDERVKQLDADQHRSQRGHAVGARRAKFVLVQIAVISCAKFYNRKSDFLYC